MTDTLAPFVGIDVGQARLDLAVGKTGPEWAVTHDATGIQKTVARLGELQPALIVLESTGGLFPE